MNPPTMNPSIIPAAPDFHPQKITTWGKVKDIFKKIWEAVKLIFYVLAGVGLFITTPSIFAIGVAVGIVFDSKCKEVSDKVTRIYRESQWKILTIIGCGAFLSLPVTAATLALSYGAHLGLSLLNQSRGNN